MQPTSGTLEVTGRVTALLELGGGFNPEFTGRENVIFQAEVLGLSSKDIARKIPEIEEFADIGQFFDQPVKTYSSGMFVRVAFAAATSVDPDILIIDEALAVGDARFQEKCYGRLRRFKEQGGSVLFVSHSIDAVAALCDRAMIIEERIVYKVGEPKQVIDDFIRLLSTKDMPNESLDTSSCLQPDGLHKSESAHDQIFDFTATADTCHKREHYNRYETRISNGQAKIIDFLISSETSENGLLVKSGSTASIFIKVFFESGLQLPIVGFELKTTNGVSISGTNSYLSGSPIRAVNAGSIRLYRIDVTLPLVEGDYFLDLGIADYDGSPGGAVLDVRRSVATIHVTRHASRKTFGLIDLAPEFREFGS